MIYGNLVDCSVHLALAGARLLDPDGESLAIVAVSGLVTSAGPDYLRITAHEVWLEPSDDGDEPESVDADPPQELTFHATFIASAQVLEEPGDEEEDDDDEEEEDDGDE